MEVPLYRQAIYHQYPVSDDSWKLAVKIAAVPPVEREIGRYVDVPDSEVAMYKLDAAMKWTGYDPEDWPSDTPVLN